MTTLWHPTCNDLACDFRPSKSGYDSGTQVFGFLKFDTVSVYPIRIVKCHASVGIQYVSDTDSTLVLKCPRFIDSLHELEGQQTFSLPSQN